MAGYDLCFCNAPATFERLMERVLAGLVWHGDLMNSDDIIVNECTWEGSLEKLARVLDECVVLI